MNNTLILKQVGKDPLYKNWHSNARALLMYVYQGSGSIVTKDRSYPIESHALILIAPGTYHYTMPNEPDSYVRSKLIMGAAEFAAILDLLQSFGYIRLCFDRPLVFARIPAELKDDIDGIFSDLSLYENTEEGAALQLSCAMRLLFYLNRFATESTAVETGYLSKAIQYINEHISSDLKLDGICASVNVSKYYFCRQFKLQLGMTVMQYILNTRIIMAKEELENSDTPISQISEQCGFSSVSYFCQAFKSEVGETPLQYRRSKLKKNAPSAGT